MSNLASMYVEVIPSVRGITGTLSNALNPAASMAARAGHDSGNAFSNAFSAGIGAAGAALAKTMAIGVGAVGAGLAAAGAVGVKTNAQLEQADIAFTTMLGSAEKADSFIASLKSFASKTPFDFPGITKASQNLIAIGISTDKVLPIMTTLGNVTSGMGTGSEGIKRATVALQQMNAAGKITAEDLNQLRDAGIPVYDLLTAATGKSKDEIAKMREEGKLGKQELEQLMTALETGKGLERFNGLMEEQSRSMAGLWATLKDTFSMGMSDIVGPITPLIKGALGGAISYITEITPGATAAIAGWVDSLYGANGALDLVGDAYFNLKAGFSGGPLIGDGDVVNMPLLHAAGETIRNIVDWVGSLDYSSFSGFFNSLTENVPGIQGLGDTLGRIGDLFVRLGPLVGAFMAELANQAPWLAGAGLALVEGALTVLNAAMPTLIAFMPVIVAAFIAWRLTSLGLLAVKLTLTAAIWAIQIAVWAYRGAVMVATAAQWLFTQAMNATPIMKIVGLIALLVGALVWFFTQTELGSQIWNWFAGVVAGAWNWIVGAVMNAWHGFILPTFVAIWNFITVTMGPVWNWFGAVIGATWAFIVTTIAVAWNDWILPILTDIWNFLTITMAPVWNWIGSVVAGVWNWIVTTIRDAWNMWIWPTLQNIWNFLTVTMGPVWNWLADVIAVAWFRIRTAMWDAYQWIYDYVLKPLKLWMLENQITWEDVKNKVIEVWTIMSAKISDAWNNFIWPVLQGLWGFIVNVLIPMWNFFWDVVSFVWNAIVTVISWAWNVIIWPLLQGAWGFITNVLIPVWNTLAEAVSGSWNWIKGIVSDAWNWIKTNVFDPMFNFLFNDVPAAWDKAVSFIGDMWNKIKEIAKTPIKWVLDEVINKGFIDTFNTIADKLPGVGKLDHIKVPGWRTGGYTGDGPEDEIAGVAHGKEYVLSAAATRKIRKDHGMAGLEYMNRHGKLPGNAAGPGTRVYGGASSFGNPLQSAIMRERKLNVTDFTGQSRYAVPAAAAAWNGIAGVQVGTGIGGPNVNVVAHPIGGAIGGSPIVGYYSGNTVELGSNAPLGNPGMRVVAIHELGHALGLPHAMASAGGNGANSIMNYDTMYGLGGPSGADIQAMEAIYSGGVTSGDRPQGGGGDGGGDGGPGLNPFQSLLDGLAGMIKDAFPGAGMFVEAASGLVQKTINDVANWFLEKLGGVWGMIQDVGKEIGDTTKMTAWATEALIKTGNLDPWNVASLVRRINQESGGDPKAVNMWDSNAGLGGTHGLMQLLQSNFDSYRDEKLPNDIYDPVANIVAAINYTRDRYGNLREGWDRKGGYSLAPTLYDDGGWLENTGKPQLIDHRRTQKPDAVFKHELAAALIKRATEPVSEGGNIEMTINGAGQDPQTVGEYAARKIMRRRGRR